MLAKPALVGELLSRYVQWRGVLGEPFDIGQEQVGGVTIER